MTRDEVQAVIDKMHEQADEHQKQYDHERKDPARRDIADMMAGATNSFQWCARVLAEALEKSEAAHNPARPIRREVRVPREGAIVHGIVFGSAWGDAPRQMPEAGPGLWRCIGLHSVDGGDMVLTVEQVTP